MEDVSLIVFTAKPNGSAIIGDWAAIRRHVECSSKEMLMI
jgi:hypothetical protein